MENSNQQVKTNEKGMCVYKSNGQDVKLSYDIVRNFLVKGTKTAVSEQDLVQFISICKFNQLNPFLNEAYLVKFANAPAQMIVSKEALFKRADTCKAYDGIQAGIIVEMNGEIVELEGCFLPSNAKLLGGWAKVYRSDRKFPIVAKVNLEEYDKKQSIWNEKKSTMICKVAKVQALREAFSDKLGAMYTAEEQCMPLAPTNEPKPIELKQTREVINIEPKSVEQIPVEEPKQVEVEETNEDDPF